jgi:RNA polymerase sigma factor (sigma-70 family)
MQRRPAAIVRHLCKDVPHNSAGHYNLYKIKLHHFKCGHCLKVAVSFFPMFTSSSEDGRKEAHVGQVDLVEQLVQRLAKGDTSARNELLTIASERLRFLVRKSLRQYPTVARWEESDDVLQGVLLRLMRALTSVTLTDGRHFFALSSTLIHRELMDLKRHYFGPEGQGANYASVAPRGDNSSAPELGATQTLDPERLTLWTEFHCRVEQLDPPLREVFDLKWYQGLTDAEAAAVLKIHPKSISRRWRESRLFLGEYLMV